MAEIKTYSWERYSNEIGDLSDTVVKVRGQYINKA